MVVTANNMLTKEVGHEPHAFDIVKTFIITLQLPVKLYKEKLLYPKCFTNRRILSYHNNIKALRIIRLNN